jgi:hypothetical protein
VLCPHCCKCQLSKVDSCDFPYAAERWAVLYVYCRFFSVICLSVFPVMCLNVKIAYLVNWIEVLFSECTRDQWYMYPDTLRTNHLFSFLIQYWAMPNNLFIIIIANVAMFFRNGQWWIVGQYFNVQWHRGGRTCRKVCTILLFLLNSILKIGAMSLYLPCCFCSYFPFNVQFLR